MYDVWLGPLRLVGHGRSPGGAFVSSDFYTLSILGVSILLIIFLCVKVRLHAFLSLLIASFFIALAARMPIEKIAGSIESGVGGTLGFLAPILALGAIIAKMMEISGSANALGHTITGIFGPRWAAWAMLAIAYICGISLFFQVGIALLLPIMFQVVNDAKQPAIKIVLSTVTSLLVVHCVIPPHPAATAIALSLHADLGRVILYGLLVGLPATIVAGPIYGEFIARRYDVKVEPVFAERHNGSACGGTPSFVLILITILCPLALMMGKTIVDLVAPKDAWYAQLVSFVGGPTIALFLAAGLSYYVMGLKQGMNPAVFSKYVEAAMGPIGAILLVMGAAGAFNRVILDSGVGEVLKDTLTVIPINPYILAWLISIVIRFAIGNATVAMMTAAGFMAPVLSARTGVDLALVSVAIGAGSIGASHVTDPGFWFVKESCGISMKDMFRAFTVSSTLASVVALAALLLLAAMLGV
jgi:GntP family gluconate:H+ symporter/D-serine transporter